MAGEEMWGSRSHTFPLVKYWCRGDRKQRVTEPSQTQEWEAVWWDWKDFNNIEIDCINTLSKWKKSWEQKKTHICYVLKSRILTKPQPYQQKKRTWHFLKRKTRVPMKFTSLKRQEWNIFKSKTNKSEGRSKQRAKEAPTGATKHGKQ